MTASFLRIKNLWQKLNKIWENVKNFNIILMYTNTEREKENENIIAVHISVFFLLFREEICHGNHQKQWNGRIFGSAVWNCKIHKFIWWCFTHGKRFVMPIKNGKDCYKFLQLKKHFLCENLLGFLFLFKECSDKVPEEILNWHRLQFN